MDGRVGGDSSFRVRVSVRGAGPQDVDVEVRARRGATVRTLAEALAERTGGDPDATLHCMRLGPVAGDVELARAGLRDGDVVALRPLPREEATHPGSPLPIVELAVVAGPDAGRRLPLSAGRHEIGRDPLGADVAIEDPSLSKRHLALEIGDDGRARVEDLGSRNGTAIDGVALDEGELRDVDAEDEIEAGRSLISLRPYRSGDPTLVETRAGKIAFNRPPRVSRPFEPVELRVPAPPREPRGVRFPLITAAIPAALGIALWLVTRSPLMLMMALFSPLMLLGSAISDRRSGRRDHRREVEAFETDLERLEARLEEARAEEVAHRRASAPDAAELAARARRRLADLWERRPGDHDFLDVRVGIADQPTTTAVAVPDGGQDDLRGRLESLVARFATVPSMPVRVALREVGAIGLSGDRDGIDRLARWLVVQAAALHSPRDLVVAAVLGEGRERDWRWLGWLPHTASESAPLPQPHVAVGAAEARELLRTIAVVCAERRAENESRTRGRPRRVSLLLLVDDDVELEPAVVDEVLDGCADVDLAAVWISPDARQLPGGSQAIVELASGKAIADVTWTASGRRIEGMSAEGVTEEIAETVARSLAAVVDVGARGAAADLPREASLLELLDAVEPDGQLIASRWDRRQPGDPLSAVLGSGAEGPFEIDLRSHGPHSLIAGTTGAGKSELLISLVASLAATHPPDRLAFLLVDYKGGAAFRECERLPHTVGMVTDLDEHLVHRVLLSLNSELKRRERLLADADASDLLRLERRDPVAAPPSLAIVIDEFATLAKEVPDFVEGVVDVAQRGRSLGLHLVLATQRPGSVVTDNIRANTNLRIALRVSEPAHSEDVIGAPDAARLRPSQAGRAFARLGPSELVPFQVGYVGGFTQAEREAEELELRELRFGAPLGEVAPGGGEEGAEGDLAALVAAISDAAELSSLPAPTPPWIPPLPEAISLAELERPEGSSEGRAAVGLVDEPRRQRRSTLFVDLAADGSLLVFGTGGSGKTTLLRTLAVALAEGASVDEVNLYGLDFAGRGLDRLAALPHCGSVIPGEDAERVQRLLGFLRRTIDARARRLSEARVSTLEDFRRLRPEEAMPRVVVLLDSYAGFTDMYERVDLGALVDALPRLLADGRAVGVHFAITADRRQAVPTAVASIVSRRLVLRMASEEEYMAIGLDAREIKGAKLPPGRGFLEDGREVQVAVAGGSDDGDAQLAEIESLARLLQEREGGRRAAPIERFPTDLDRSELPPASLPLEAVLGVEETELAPVGASLRDMHFMVAGPYRSGRSTALATLAASLRESTPGLQVHLLAPRRSPLPELDLWSSASRGIEQCEEAVAELLGRFLAGEDEGPVLVVLDDGGELSESRAAGELEQLIKRGRDRNLRFAVAFETAEARHYAGWIRELRKDGHGLLLDPDLDLDGDLLGVRLPRRSNPVHPSGRGYLVAAGVSQQIQTARPASSS